jgi:choline dehydrogenase
LVVTEEVDFVVVGAGSSGCVLANRLTEDGTAQVMVLEAGPRDRSFWIHLPIGYGRTMWNPRLNWKFYTEPEPTMAGRRIYWPRGRTLGGSSSINGLIVIRGQPEDYDHWQALGNPGWGWHDVLPYFRKLETNENFADDQLHGAHGPVHVSSIPPEDQLINAIIETAVASGVPRNDDFNGPRQEGVGYYQLTTRRGWRVSSAVGYLRAARGRSNLAIRTNAHALRILQSDGRARGIEYVQDGVVRQVRARRGVILSAGAIQSPQLLMLSGIGPAAMLRKHGVPVRIDRPAVGQGLQDHLQVRMIYRCNQPITTNDRLRTFGGRARMAFQWLLRRSGPLAIGINQCGLFTRVLPQSKTPDIQFHIGTLSADMAGGKVHDFSGFTMSVCQLRPESRGSIELASGDARTPPLIRANYLDAEVDRRCTVAGIQFARRLARQQPLASYIDAEMQPKHDLVDDDDTLQFAREHGVTIFHPTGTCRMGADDDAVVDPRLRVRGVDGLWVVDCSIMPTIISGNTNVPAIMIAEKASTMIQQDA